MQDAEVTTMTTATNQFTIGQRLACRSLCDYDCIFRFEVVARTAKFVTLKYFNDLKRVGIKVDRDGNEYCLPLGNHSMAAYLQANDLEENV
jgi:hypothetical protein